MTGSPPAGERCGIDTVAIDRVGRMLEANDAASIARLFAARELADAGEGPGRAASLAARFAAKEACLKLFPRETALETIAASDFSIERDAYGAPQVVPGPAAEVVMGRYRIARIALSMSHDATNATAVKNPRSLRMMFIFVSPVGSDEESSVRAIASCTRRGRGVGEEVGWKCAIIRAHGGNGNNFQIQVVQYMALR